MKTYKKIREELKLSRSKFAAKLGKTLHSYLDAETYGRKIDTKDLPTVRRLAHEAGLSDGGLLDLLCSEKPPKRKRYPIKPPK